MFFMNPFFEDFRGNLLLSDRQYNPTFSVKGNFGRTQDGVMNWANGSVFDLSGNDADGNSKANLKINFAYRDYTRWNSVSVSVSGVSASSTNVSEIVAKLNANDVFSTYFTASLKNETSQVTMGAGTPDRQKDSQGNIYNNSYNPLSTISNNNNKIYISSNKSGQVRFFVDNTGAESVLRFNQRAGIADIPSYFVRHTWDNVLNFTDCTGSLVKLSGLITDISKSGSNAVITSYNHGLDGTTINIARSDSTGNVNGTALTATKVSADTFTVGKTTTAVGHNGVWVTPLNATVIAGATDNKGTLLGYSYTTGKFDQELFAGVSGIFTCQNLTLDTNTPPRIVQIIEYSTGSVAGSLGKKIIYTYTSTNATPDTIREYPYTLTSLDV